MRLGRYTLTNGLRDDGSVFLGNLRTKRIIWALDFPVWFVDVYNRLAAQLGRRRR